jgi:hypothetical protein
VSALYFDEEEAVRELRERGYRVLKVDFPDKVSNIKDLVDYFYACRMYYNPDREFPISRNFDEDQKYMSVFVKKRQDMGLSRIQAVRECSMLIEAAFRFEKHLQLKEPILSPQALTVGFIMEKVCAIVNDEIAEASEEETRRYIDEINEIYETEFAQRDAERAADSRRRIMEGLHDQRSNRNPQSRTKCD